MWTIIEKLLSMEMYKMIIPHKVEYTMKDSSIIIKKQSR